MAHGGHMQGPDILQGVYGGAAQAGPGMWGGAGPPEGKDIGWEAPGTGDPRRPLVPNLFTAPLPQLAPSSGSHPGQRSLHA